MNEYPTEKELKYIKRFKPGIKNSFKPLIDHIQDIWHWPDYVKWDGDILELHTGGWSGNEDIIQALENTMFWLLFWKATTRGGHYYFEIPENRRQ